MYSISYRCVVFCLSISFLPYMTMAASFANGLREYPSLRLYADKLNLILGSGSFTRKLILKTNSFKFDVVKADINERELGDRSINSNPSDLVQLLSHAKADAIIQKIVDQCIPFDHRAVLLTADQVVVHNNQILEKPNDEAQARQFIALYNENQCSTVGSITLTHLLTRKRVTGVSTATIHFKRIPDEVIDDIIAEGVCLQCAGGLMVEHELLQPFLDGIDGTVDSVMGLSCNLLEDLLRELDVEQLCQK